MQLINWHRNNILKQIIFLAVSVLFISMQFILCEVEWGIGAIIVGSSGGSRFGDWGHGRGSTARVGLGSP